MQEGIPISKQLCQVKIEPLYDIVIASAGGYPKDINLYQAQKGLTNAAAICKPGGASYWWRNAAKDPAINSSPNSCMENIVSPR
jgi:nickel-dependent lactate racemase